MWWLFYAKVPDDFFSQDDLTQLHPGQLTIFISLFVVDFLLFQLTDISSQHCQLLTRVCPINQKYTTFSSFYSDESQIVVGSNNCVYVWRKGDQVNRLDLVCRHSQRKVSVMIWGVFIF
jgi:hypothetical protein